MKLKRWALLALATLMIAIPTAIAKFNFNIMAVEIVPKKGEPFTIIVHDDNRHPDWEAKAEEDLRSPLLADCHVLARIEASVGSLSSRNKRGEATWENGARELAEKAGKKEYRDQGANTVEIVRHHKGNYRATPDLVLMEFKALVIGCSQEITAQLQQLVEQKQAVAQQTTGVREGGH